MLSYQSIQTSKLHRLATWQKDWVFLIKTRIGKLKLSLQFFNLFSFYVSISFKDHFILQTSVVNLTLLTWLFRGSEKPLIYSI
jgi:hypothetical protein